MMILRVLNLELFSKRIDLIKCKSFFKSLYYC